MATTKKPVFLPRNNDQGAMARALGEVQAVPVSTPVKSAMSIEGKVHSAELQVGQTYELPLFRFQKSENNARVTYDSEEVDRMSESLKNGQDVPAIGYVKNGKVTLVDGQKRFQAATSGGFDSLKVLIQAPPLNDREEYEASRRINLERSTQTPFDDSVRWHELLTRGVYTSQDDLAESMNVGKALVSKVLALANIPDRLVRRMNESAQTKSLSTAYEIAGLFEAFKNEPEKAVMIAEDVIEVIQRDSLNRNLAKDLIVEKVAASRPAEPPRTRERAESNVVKFGEHKGTLKVFASRGQLDLSFKDLSEEKVEELKQRIESVLTGQIPM